MSIASWGTLPIEVLPENIELPLLPSQAARRMDRRVLLPCPVHARVHPVLLGLPRLAQLWIDPQLTNDTESSEVLANAFDANGTP
ncbi:MAG: hypothetical protein P8X64_15805 [Anaerolineales bacterium]